MKRYSATVIGAGRGGHLNLQGMLASDRFSVAAVCDLRQAACDAIAAHHPDIRTFTDYRDMLREVPTDIVCVATLPPSHEAIVRDALALPLKGIVVEKPLGHTTESAARILSALKARRLPVAVPHGLLVKRAQMEIVERVRSGAIGTLKLVEIQCRGWDIINAGIHWLNFFCALTEGDPVYDVLAACDATSRTFRDGMQVETLGVTSAQTQSGVRVVMHTGDDTVVNSGRDETVFRILGSQGMIECGAFGEQESQYYLQNKEHPCGATLPVAEDDTTRHQRHLENLAAMIDSGEPDYAVADSSFAALELCEAAYLSNRLRCAVRLPLSVFSAPKTELWDPGRPYDGSGGGRDGRKL